MVLPCRERCSAELHEEMVKGASKSWSSVLWAIGADQGKFAPTDQDTRRRGHSRQSHCHPTLIISQAPSTDEREVMRKHSK